MWTMTQLLCRCWPQSLCDPTWSGLLAEDGIGCPVGMVRVSVWVSEKVLGPNSLDFRSYYSHVQGPAATAWSGSWLEMQGLRPPRPAGLKPVSHQARQGAQAPSTSGSSGPGHCFPDGWASQSSVELVRILTQFPDRLMTRSGVTWPDVWLLVWGGSPLACGGLLERGDVTCWICQEGLRLACCEYPCVSASIPEWTWHSWRGLQTTSPGCQSV